MQYEEDREREHLDDEHWNYVEPPELILQNTNKYKITQKQTKNKSTQITQNTPNEIKKQKYDTKVLEANSSRGLLHMLAVLV